MHGHLVFFVFFMHFVMFFFVMHFLFFFHVWLFLVHFSTYALDGFLGSIGIIMMSNPSFFFKTSVVMLPSSSDGLEKHEAKNTSKNIFLIEPEGLEVMLESQER